MMVKIAVKAKVLMLILPKPLARRLRGCRAVPNARPQPPERASATARSKKAFNPLKTNNSAKSSDFAPQ
jgi:hypothetical protein